MRRWGVFACLVLVVAALAPPAPPAAAADHGVRVVDNAYNPTSVTITAGDAVVWTQEGTRPHSVTRTSEPERFDSHPTCPPLCMQQGQTFRWQFNTPGTFTYFCRIHAPDGQGSMVGTIVVQAAQAPPTTAQPRPTTTTARPATTTTAPGATTTSSSTTVESTTTTSSSSTTSTTEPASTTTLDASEESAGGDDGDDDGGAPAWLILVAILAVAGGGGYALWRVSPWRPGGRAAP